MTVAILVLLALLVAVAVVRLALEVSARVRRPPAIDRYVGHRLTLHLRDGGPSLRGVLAVAAPDALELARAEHLGERGVTALEGRQVIPRERLEFFQVLDAAGGESR